MSSSIAVAWLTTLHSLMQVNPSLLQLVSLVSIYKAGQCVTLLIGVQLKGHSTLQQIHACVML